MTPVRLGAVGYLNARPLVHGLERSPRFTLRFDVPSRCSALLHEGAIDVGLIPSIEYLRGPAAYRIVPDLAIASRGPVTSVALYTRKALRDVRSIAMDVSSRTSVALVRVLCAKAFAINPTLNDARPDLSAMLADSDAALVIGDNALFLPHGEIQKIDLGEVWTNLTGLPFVYAFWAGREGALTDADVHALQNARDSAVGQPEVIVEIARAYAPDSKQRQAVAARYLQDNIKYHLGSDERAGLELFFRYAAEAGLVTSAQELRFWS